jgi:hypothetical protein
MAIKNYIISCSHPDLDGANVSFDSTALNSDLTGAGATIVNDFDHINGGFFEITIDEANLSNVTGLANVVAAELVGAEGNVATLSISEATTEWHKQRLVTRNLPLRTTFDPVYTGENTIVYVVDSGCDIYHPELAGSDIWPVHNPSVGSYNDWLAGGGTGVFDIADDHGHGTAVASLINGDSVGVAGNATVGVVKISGADGNADISDVINGFDSLWEHARYHSGPNAPGLKHTTTVVCCAWTFPKSQVLDRVAEFMWKHRFLVVAAAGNHGGDVDNYSPAGLNSILTVGASDSSDNVPSFSNDAGAIVEQGSGLQTNGGEEVDVFAPGVSVNHATIANRNVGGGYDDVAASDTMAIGSGTSVSAAIASAVCAIAVDRNEGYRPEQVKDFVVSQSLTGMLFQDPSLYSSTPNNILYLENEYYASVWNTNPGSIGESLLSDAGNLNISLNVSASVTSIASSDYATLPSALQLNGNADSGWSITANTDVTSGISNSTVFNFILTATKSDNTEYNRHFTVGLYSGTEITEEARSSANEVYYIDDDGTLEEVSYVKGLQAAFQYLGLK